MSDSNPTPNPWLQALEKQMEKTCFCKWRTQCTDKNSDECYAKHNPHITHLQTLHKPKH